MGKNKINFLNYHKLLNEKNQSKKKYKEKLRLFKKSLNKEYIKNNKWKVLILDLALILVIFSNIGALLTTNALVVRENPDTEFKEANPIQCDWNGYSCAIDGMKFMFSFLNQCILWTIIIGWYIYIRKTVFSEEGYWLLLMIMLFYVVVTSLDFINNLGYYIGKVLFGY